jgi:hypothetical protein
VASWLLFPMLFPSPAVREALGCAGVNQATVRGE